MIGLSLVFGLGGGLAEKLGKWVEEQYKKSLEKENLEKERKSKYIEKEAKIEFENFINSYSPDAFLLRHLSNGAKSSEYELSQLSTKDKTRLRDDLIYMVEFIKDSEHLTPEDKIMISECNSLIDLVHQNTKNEEYSLSEREKLMNDVNNELDDFEYKLKSTHKTRIAFQQSYLKENDSILTTIKENREIFNDTEIDIAKRRINLSNSIVELIDNGTLDEEEGLLFFKYGELPNEPIPYPNYSDPKTIRNIDLLNNEVNLSHTQNTPWRTMAIIEPELADLSHDIFGKNITTPETMLIKKVFDPNFMEILKGNKQEDIFETPSFSKNNSDTYPSLQK